MANLSKDDQINRNTTQAGRTLAWQTCELGANPVGDLHELLLRLVLAGSELEQALVVVRLGVGAADRLEVPQTLLLALGRGFSDRFKNLKKVSLGQSQKLF